MNYYHLFCRFGHFFVAVEGKTSSKLYSVDAFHFIFTRKRFDTGDWLIKNGQKQKYSDTDRQNQIANWHK